MTTWNPRWSPYLNVLLLLVLRLSLLPLDHLLLVLVLLLRLPATAAAGPVLRRVRAEHELRGDAVAERGEVAVLRRDELGHIDPGGWDLLVCSRKDGHGLCLHLDVVVSYKL